LKDNVTLVAGQNISLTTNANGLQISANTASNAATSANVTSDYPRIAWLNPTNFATTNVVVNATGPGWLQQINWDIKQFVPTGPVTIGGHFVSIQIDNDSPQYFPLYGLSYVSSFPVTAYNYTTYDSIPLGNNWDWDGSAGISFIQKLVFTNRLLITCYFPSGFGPALAPIVPPGYTLQESPVTSGNLRVIYILGQ
jgi:hypothetical protein